MKSNIHGNDAGQSEAWIGDAQITSSSWGAELVLSADGLSDAEGFSASGHEIITLAEESKAAKEPQEVDADKSNLRKP
jgi:hypothetical protein